MPRNCQTLSLESAYVPGSPGKSSTSCDSLKGKRMPKTRPKAGYTLRDSPLFRLRSRRRLAELLHAAPATLADVAKHPHPYKRRWKHKVIRDGQPGSWLNQEPTGSLAQSYRPIDIPDPRPKSMQARIAARTHSGFLMLQTTFQAAQPTTSPGFFSSGSGVLSGRDGGSGSPDYVLRVPSARFALQSDLGLFFKPSDVERNRQDRSRRWMQDEPLRG